MKKNYLLSIIAVCTCLFTACNKEIDTPQTEGSEEKNEGVITYIRATGNENESKGSIDGDSGSFYWNEGDQIAVWNNGAYQSSIALSAEDGDIVGEKPANATFRFSGELNNRANFAVFPASIADGDHAISGDFSINLPGTYKLDDVAGEKSPVPMIAVNDGDNLHFKQLGALLRITLNNLPPSTKSVTIDFNGKKVWGSFPVASTVVPGSSNIVTKAATGDDAGKDVITINITGDHGWIDNQDVNIPVPTGTYTTITVKSLDVDGKCTLQMTRWIKVASGISSNWNPIRTSARKVIASLPAFSISEDRNTRVEIAASNVYKDSDGWHFFTNPYDCILGNGTTTHVNGGITSSSLDPEVDTKEKRLGDIAAILPRDVFQWAEITGGTEYNTIDMGAITAADWELCSDFSMLEGEARGATLYSRVILTADNGYPEITLTMMKLKTTADSYTGSNFWESNKTIGGTSGVFFFPDNWPEDLNTETISDMKNATYQRCRSFTLIDDVNYSPEPNPYAIAGEITKDVFGQLLSAGAVFFPAHGYVTINGWYSFLGRSIGSWCSKIDHVNDAGIKYPLSFDSIDTKTGKSFTITTSGVSEIQFRSVRLVRELE